VFGGLILVFLLLLAVGVHSCQVSQRKNALRDYNRRVTSISTESSQTGTEFFKLLGQNSNQSPQDLQTAISGYRVQAEQQLKQAQGVSTPDQMKSAQQSLQIALELRRDGLAAVAQRIRTALGDQGEAADAAISQIAAQMQGFNASDVLYSARVVPFIRHALADNGVAGQQVAHSRFMNDVAWMSPPFVAQKLGQQLTNNNGSRTGQPTGPGLHGTGLDSSAYGNTTLQPGAPNHLTYQAGQAFTVTFSNQGENDEFDIKVMVTIQPNTGKPITLTRTVPKVARGETAHANVALDRMPPVGSAVTIHVNVAPVPGEKKTDNNKADYPAIFSR
jgi:flagellar hook-basal body complex protein FliE